jgi:hypothetical protein
MYVVLKQFIPGNDQIWVTKLDANDPEYIYDNLEETILKAEELEAADTSGRKYKAAPAS